MSKMLKISEAASLAMHTLVLLATNPDRVMATREVAGVFGVSEAHLSKVLQRLGRMGLVNSTRGPKGGFVLGRPAEDVTLMDVYEAIEGPLEPSVCLMETPSCSAKRCILGDLVHTVNDLVERYLSGTRLSELVDVFGDVQTCGSVEK